MNVLDFQSKKEKAEKLTMVTCYDFWSAEIVNQTSIDALLVGDSLAMVMHGHPTTLPATLDLMQTHIRAVVRGAPDKFIVGDLPFLSHRKGFSESMDAVQKIMQAGARAIKLEGCSGNCDLIRHVVDSGVPVMGHLGLTPQSIHKFGGFRVQAKTEELQKRLLSDCLDLEAAGCFALVLECIPAKIAQKITQSLSIPTIGIGAGSHVDGQILVLQDLLGTNPNFKPKFVKTYLNTFELFQNALNQYHKEVTDGTFPEEKHTYKPEFGIKKSES